MIAKPKPIIRASKIFISKGFSYKSIIILTIISLIAADITLLIHVISPLEFLLLILMPSIARNISLTYITYKAGFKPSILYRWLTEVPVFILPIFPMLGTYFDSLIKFMLPLLLMYVIYKNFVNAKNKEITSGKGKSVLDKVSLFFVTIFLIAIISLTSGLFKYFAITIGSNSMQPKISKGDIVIVEKLKPKELEKLKIGDVLIFKHGGIMIVHRLIRINEVSGIKYYYTKGDNNNGEDGYPISVSDIVGKKTSVIPYLEYPTLMIKEIFD